MTDALVLTLSTRRRLAASKTLIYDLTPTVSTFSVLHTVFLTARAILSKRLVVSRVRVPLCVFFCRSDPEIIWGII